MPTLLIDFATDQHFGHYDEVEAAVRTWLNDEAQVYDEDFKIDVVAVHGPAAGYPAVRLTAHRTALYLAMVAYHDGDRAAARAAVAEAL